MKVLGISGSPRQGQTTDIMVQEVLNGVEGDTEFISLSGKRIGSCLGCLGCVKDNVCKIKDDMSELRQKIVAADALVIGAPNYYGMLNSLSHCFLERFYQFRHREGDEVAGKLGVAVGVAGRTPDLPVRDIENFFTYNKIECIGAVTAVGPASCFTCGHGETCRVGSIHMTFGPGTKITKAITPDLAKQQEKIAKARALGRELGNRLLMR